MDKKFYVDSYMVEYGLCFMICQNLHYAHFQEVGLMQFQTNCVNYIICTCFGWESRALTITWARPLAHVWSGPRSHSAVYILFTFTITRVHSSSYYVYLLMCLLHSDFFWVFVRNILGVCVLFGWFFHVHQLLSSRFTQQNLCGTSKSPMKQQPNRIEPPLI